MELNFKKVTVFIIKDNNELCPYAVFLNTGKGFNQQISPWYFRRGNAVNWLRGYVKRHSISPQFEEHCYINVEGCDLLKRVKFVHDLY